MDLGYLHQADGDFEHVVAQGEVAETIPCARGALAHAALAHAAFGVCEVFLRVFVEARHFEVVVSAIRLQRRFVSKRRMFQAEAWKVVMDMTRLRHKRRAVLQPISNFRGLLFAATDVHVDVRKVF